MSKQQPGQEAGGTDPLSEAGRQALIAAAAALAAGLVSLTFVAVVGGAVLMARLRGAGLPTEAGIAVQPRSVLLAVGGEVLAPAIAVSLAAVFAVHFWPQSRQVVPLGAYVQGPSPWSRIRSRWLSRSSIFAVLIVMLGLGYYLGWSAGALHFPLQIAIFGVIAAFALGVARVSGRLAAKAVEARDRRYELARERPIEQPPEPAHWHLVRVETKYLAGVAVALLLYATIAAVTASLADPKIRPAAVLFNDDRGPLCGVFVAENADHVYIAEAVEDPHIRNVGRHSQGRMFDLPRATVRALVLGAGQSISDTHVAAPKLLDELMQIHHIRQGSVQALDCRQTALNSLSH